MEDGLRQLLGEAEAPRSRSRVDRPAAIPGEEPGPLPEDVAGLVAEAQRLYDEAQAALDDGDLGTYQERIDELADASSPRGADRSVAAPSPSASP